MSLCGDALAALRSIILIEERLTRISDRLDDLAGEMRHLSTRLTRLETLIDITRQDGAVVKIAPELRRMTAATLDKPAKE